MMFGEQYCPNCGCPRCAERRITDRDQARLITLRAAAEQHGARLSWNTLRLPDGTLEAWLRVPGWPVPKPMIGCRSVGHLREMATAMLELDVKL